MLFLPVEQLIIIIVFLVITFITFVFIEASLTLGGTVRVLEIGVDALQFSVFRLVSGIPPHLSFCNGCLHLKTRNT
jgi:hypothetical protein